MLRAFLTHRISRTTPALPPEDEEDPLLTPLGERLFFKAPCRPAPSSTVSPALPGPSDLPFGPPLCYPSWSLSCKRQLLRKAKRTSRAQLYNTHQVSQNLTILNHDLEISRS